jgi:dihydrofolate reductase
MIISHLVALSNNFVIGVNNDLPWKLKKDLQHFSAYTQNKAIVMGRKTFESIGRPLPNRKNIVISSSLESQESLEVVPNLNQAIEVASQWNKDNSAEKK